MMIGIGTGRDTNYCYFRNKLFPNEKQVMYDRMQLTLAFDNIVAPRISLWLKTMNEARPNDILFQLNCFS